MARRRLTGPGATVDGLEPHYPHESADTFPVDAVVLVLQLALACSPKIGPL